MKYISEERLLEICALDRVHWATVDYMVSQCTELNPWQPMTGQAWNNIESAPKDRPVLLYGGHVPCCQMFVGHADANWYWKPAHWCELPLDPPSV